MEAIFFLIPLSMLFVFGALVVFVWSVKNGQYDDMDKEAWRILEHDQDDSSGSNASVEIGTEGYEKLQTIKQVSGAINKNDNDK